MSRLHSKLLSSPIKTCIYKLGVILNVFLDNVTNTVVTLLLINTLRALLMTNEYIEALSVHRTHLL